MSGEAKERLPVLVDVAFDIGDFVELRTQPGEVGQVTGFLVRKSMVIYMVTFGHTDEEHYDFELREVDEPQQPVGGVS